MYWPANTWAPPLERYWTDTSSTNTVQHTPRLLCTANSSCYCKIKTETCIFNEANLLCSTCSSAHPKMSHFDVHRSTNQQTNNQSRNPSNETPLAMRRISRRLNYAASSTYSSLNRIILYFYFNAWLVECGGLWNPEAADLIDFNFCKCPLQMEMET